jgi:sugar O-acyltransferase (sialic acid O-acetyltransferase NeuD family)
MPSKKSEAREMIFWGGTGQAKVLRECMRTSGYKLIAVIDNNESLEPPFSDVPLLFGKKGFEEWFSTLSSPKMIGFLVTIGGQKGKDRIAIQNFLESYGIIPLIARHPTAYVADSVSVGAGSQILAQAAINVGAALGRGCIVNTGATVDHECVLGDGVHIGPGSTLAGCIVVEDYATVYAGATILPRVKIGQGAVVGAGAVVLHDVPPDEVVVGNPAKPIFRK